MTNMYVGHVYRYKNPYYNTPKSHPWEVQEEWVYLRVLDIREGWFKYSILKGRKDNKNRIFLADHAGKYSDFKTLEFVE